MKYAPFFFFFFSFLLAGVKPDLAGDRLAILAIRSSVGGRSILWNISQPSTPCTWPGVVCDNTTNRVVELHFPGMGLSGELPLNTLGNLTQLTTLSLRYNALSGQLPTDIFSLVNLRNLYLQNNLFSGPIPDLFSPLGNLVRVSFASNNFSGNIPSSIGNLTRLATLYLENNALSGSIPDLNRPSIALFNVSNNQLTGGIPSKFVGFPESAFSGNSLCGGPLVSCNGSETGSSSSDKLSGGAIAGIVIGSLLGVLLILLILFFLCCKKRKQKDEIKTKDLSEVKQVEIEIPADSSSSGFPSLTAAVGGGGAKGKSGEVNKKLVFMGKNKIGKFDLEDLLRASAEVLGKGTFGTAYKAVLEVGFTVAVKRLKDVTMAEKEFREKIESVGRMDHENLLPLRAYYFNGEEKLLVCDYIPTGSLSALLHGNRGAGRMPLNWEMRSMIALGAARGIAYLHSQGAKVSHGNIKSSNVLLTPSYESRVSDFGLAQLVGPNATPTRVDGYRAPEVTDIRKVSQKADVYSFGVLLLELLTGKAPTHALLNDEGVDLPRWVQSVVREEWTSEVFDLELLRDQNVEDDMVQLLQLAINCSAQYPDKRPSMAEVSNQIEEICHSSGSQQDRTPPSDTVSDS
ncbi:probable inactive receptor kinase At1g48480 [Cynara cardunculus var. scolymus]|uniref:Leucine rich repeat 4 n=1 Tax=Cynara cardunculus var. scolymus TaxID=59895 RepID=A0A118JUI2_CYNCS|nr:probable inactive receptor kinase At1g48480 [Cynara cardunculus var. scolymus]KVH92109.1 Leucine rich repeat 4 [Cynara cardunculus var. scolymus]